MEADAALQQATGSNNNVGNLLQQEKTDLSPQIQNFQKTASAQPAAPELQKAPEAPKSNFAQDATEWVGIMNVLAGIGGAKSRQGATTALQAFSAGIDGLKKGKQEAFAQAHDEWKDANQEVLDNNKSQIEAYKSVLDNKKLSLDEQMAQIKTVASQYHNDIMAQLAESRNFTAVARVVDMKQEQDEKLQLSYKKLAKQVEEFDKKLDEKIKEKTDALKPTLSDEAISSNAEALHKGLQPKDLGLTTRTKDNPNLIATINAWHKKYPDDDIASAQKSWISEKSGASSVGRTSAQIKLASNILDESLPSLLAEAKKYGLGPSTDLNTMVNFIKKHASDQEYTNFSTQLRAVTTDYMMFIGRGKPTVHSDEEALKILKDNGGPTSLQGFADAVNIEQQNVDRGIDKTQGKAPQDSGGATHTYNPATGQLE